jgi:regulatory protein
MPTITRLAQGKKNPNRVNLYLDNQFAFALSIDEVGKHGLKKSLELTGEQVEALKATDESEYVYAKILNFLSYRPRTIKEVRDRLWKYDVKDIVAQNTLIERLKSRSYLDDVAFARWFIESRNTHRPRSRRLLTQELKSKGLTDEVILSVIDEAADESETIRRLLSKKLGVPHVLDRDIRQKMYAYLSRQGFAWESIKEVVKTWESE